MVSMVTAMVTSAWLTPGDCWMSDAELRVAVFN